MGPFDIVLDDRGIRLLERLQNVRPFMATFLEQLSHKLSDESIIMMRKMTHSVARWDGADLGTGALSASLSYNIDMSAGGFNITFHGLDYGNLMDIGNGPPGSRIYPKNGDYLMVNSRQSNNAFKRKVASVGVMGSKTPGVPTHFSENISKDLNSRMHELADEFIQELLERMVS